MGGYRRSSIRTLEYPRLLQRTVKEGDGSLFSAKILVQVENMISIYWSEDIRNTLREDLIHHIRFQIFKNVLMMKVARNIPTNIHASCIRKDLMLR